MFRFRTMKGTPNYLDTTLHSQTMQQFMIDLVQSNPYLCVALVFLSNNHNFLWWCQETCFSCTFAESRSGNPLKWLNPRTKLIKPKTACCLILQIFVKICHFQNEAEAQRCLLFYIEKGENDYTQIVDRVTQ